MTLAPYVELEGVEVAAIGLSNMVNVGGAVLEFRLRKERVLRSASSSNGDTGSVGRAPAKGVLAHMVVIGNGRLLVASSQEPRRVLVDGVPGVFSHDPVAGTTEVQLPVGPKLTRDVSLSY